MGPVAAFVAAAALSFLLIFERQGRLPAVRGVPALALRMVVDGAMGVAAFYVLDGSAGPVGTEIVRGVAAGVGFEAIARNRTPPFNRVPYEAIMDRLDSKIYAHGASRDLRDLNKYVEAISSSAESIADSYAEWLDFNVGITTEQVASFLRDVKPFVRTGNEEQSLSEVPRRDAQRRKKGLIRRILKNGHGEFLADFLDP